MPAQRVTIPASDLHDLTAAIFTAAGMEDDQATSVAEVLVWANLRGVDSHGVTRIPRYLELFDSGEAKPRPQMTLSRRAGAVALLDADGAPGPVAMRAAMQAAIDAARESGVAWVGVRGTVHTGAIGYYTSMAAEADMIGIAVVAGVPNMAYHGTRGAGVATSPLSVAVPAGEGPPLLLDMATAVIALGKIAQHRARGVPLPPGAALTRDGEPTQDPQQAAIPLPVGGAKGSAMSLAFELISSVLVGNPIVSRFHSDDPDGRRHRQNAAVIAVDIAAFQPVESFTAAAAATLAAVKHLPPADGVDEALIPGERGARAYRDRLEHGIPLAPAAWKGVRAAAETLGVDISARVPAAAQE